MPYTRSDQLKEPMGHTTNHYGTSTMDDEAHQSDLVIKEMTSFWLVQFIRLSSPHLAHLRIIDQFRNGSALIVTFKSPMFR